MKPTTPETDAAIALANDPDGAPEVCDLCRKLERERNQAREVAAYWRGVATGVFSQSVPLPWEVAASKN